MGLLNDFCLITGCPFIPLGPASPFTPGKPLIPGGP